MERKRELNKQLSLLLDQGLVSETQVEIKQLVSELITFAKLEARTMHLIPGQPYIDKPRIRINCEDRSIGIVRESGGLVKIVLGRRHHHGTIPMEFDSVMMRNGHQFMELWNLLKSFAGKKDESNDG